MAKVFLTGNPVQKVLYTVEHTVGTGGANRRDDVLLVQLFLRVQMEDGGSEAPSRPPDRRPLAIDGICGNDTLAYIRYYQEEAKRRFPGDAQPPDGRVDPMRSGSIFASITQKKYMIAVLNIGYRENRGDRYLDIGSDPLFSGGPEEVVLPRLRRGAGVAGTHGRDRLDLDLPAAAELVHGDDGAGGSVRSHDARINVVDAAPEPGVRDVDGHLEDVREVAARRDEHGLHVAQRALGLLLESARKRVRSSGILAELARDVYEAAVHDPLGIVARGRRRVLREDGLHVRPSS